MRCLHPFLQFFVLLVAVVPYVPLVKGKVDLFFAMFLCFYSITDGNHTGDKIIHAFGACKEIRSVTRLISIVLMQRKIIHLIVSLVKNRILPGTKSRHLQIGASAGNCLNFRVHKFHQAGCLCRNSSVLCRSLMSHLPRAIHLVSETP